VLVLAAHTGSDFEDVHDFANYPALQPFVSPRFEGALGYEVVGDEVVLRAARVVNPRPAYNLSGSLALELRALTRASDSLEGVVLASAPLGRIEGQSALDGIELRAARAPAPAGAGPVALVLVEYSAEGFIARDVFRFPPAEVEDSAPPPPPAPSRTSIQTATVEELAAVPGISRKVAIEIVKARPFRSVDELVKTRGIGDKLLRRLRDRLTV
jgi:DNA uptake protein ComE-like DNA-binding protein